MQVRTVAGGLGVLVLWSGLCWAEAPPACEGQVSDLYRTLAADRQVYDVPQGTWSQQLTAIGSQIRIVTTQYKMQQQATEQAQGQAALQAEVVRQLQQSLATVRTSLEQAEARLKELEPPPQAAR
jgi:hypothetical protein